MLKSSAFLLPVIPLLLIPTAGMCESLRQIKWAVLAPVVTNQRVSIAFPDGAVVSGKAIAVESEALVVKVSKTSAPRQHPKGELRVPRANLHVLEMRTKRHLFRVILTPVGTIVGFAGGAGAALAIQGGLFSNENQGQAAAAFVGIGVAGGVAGYFVGNSADRRTVTIEIIPE